MQNCRRKEVNIVTQGQFISIIRAEGLIYIGVIDESHFKKS